MKSGRIYIYGAHSRGATLAEYLSFLHPDRKIEAFLYGNGEQNPGEWNGIPVWDINEFSGKEFSDEDTVYIATRGIYHEEIIRTVLRWGNPEIIPVTYELDIQLRNAYVEAVYDRRNEPFLKLEELGVDALGSGSARSANRELSACIYVAKSTSDAKVQTKVILSGKEKIIFAGAALEAESVESEKALLRDDCGENISEKNRQFCELTVLYHVWKHAREAVVGLAHYRRHFLLPEDWLERMEQHGIDIVLPVPLYVYPDIAGNYKNRHVEEVWECMLRVMEQENREEATRARLFFESTGLYSPCNMFIMKREILEDYCGWLFPKLFRIGEEIGQLEDGYQNRYPGFLAERLLTFYCHERRDKYKIAYADKNFLV